MHVVHAAHLSLQGFSFLRAVLDETGVTHKDPVEIGSEPTDHYPPKRNYVGSSLLRISIWQSWRHICQDVSKAALFAGRSMQQLFLRYCTGRQEPYFWRFLGPSPSSRKPAPPEEEVENS